MRVAEVGSDLSLKLKRSVRIGFGLVTACYMLTGMTALAAGGYFMTTHDTSRRSAMLTSNVLHSLLAAGIYIALSALVGVYGSLAPLTRKNWLIAYIVLIVGAVLVETGIGIWMWSRTLDIDDLYGHNWRYLWSDDIKRSFQDKGQCCGYLNSKDSPAPGSDSCTNTAIPYGCMVSVQQYTHGYLTYIYSWLFGFVFVAVIALLAAMVLMVVRNDEERLRWSRANAIFRSLKKANSDTTLYGPEPKSYQDDLYKSIYSVSAQ